MINLKNIDTEKRNVNSMNLDELNAKEIVTIINQEDQKIAVAIEEKIDEIAQVVEVAGKTISENGRVIYIGAGTSGRLGILDAVECPPTFGVDFDVIIGLIAGGDKAFIQAQEGSEDSKELAIEDLKEINLTSKDFVIGIAASGRTPYVIGGLELAKEIGVKTASLAITSNSEIAKYADYPIEVVVGPEVLTGSTRMKAGTAQKMILNMISTGAMIQNGKVYENLMVDVKQSNLKLVQRAINIIQEATECDHELAKSKLDEGEGNAKTAIVMILNDYSLQEAKEHLKETNGFIKK